MCHHFLPCAMASHTAKLPFFAVCCPRGTRQRWHCLPCAWPCGTRQTAHVACWVDGVTLFCRGPIKHTAMALRAHGKHPPCRLSFAVRYLPCVTHGKSFAECFWVFGMCFDTWQTHFSRSEYSSRWNYYWTEKLQPKTGKTSRCESVWSMTIDPWITSSRWPIRESSPCPFTLGVQDMI